MGYIWFSIDRQRGTDDAKVPKKSFFQATKTKIYKNYLQRIFLNGNSSMKLFQETVSFWDFFWWKNQPLKIWILWYHPNPLRSRWLQPMKAAPGGAFQPCSKPWSCKAKCPSCSSACAGAVESTACGAEGHGFLGGGKYGESDGWNWWKDHHIAHGHLHLIISICNISKISSKIFLVSLDTSDCICLDVGY